MKKLLWIAALLLAPMPALAHPGVGIVMDSRGNVYVAVMGARKVKRVSPAGQVEVVAESPLGWAPTGGFAAPNGDLWLLEYSLAAVRVRRISRDSGERIY